MGRVHHSWRQTCALAQKESDPNKLLSRIECTITALEGRYAEWGSDPGTPAELISIKKALSVLERLMNETLARYGEAPRREVAEISGAAQFSLAKELGHVRHLFLLLRS